MANATAQALCYLADWERRATAPGGLAHVQLLRDANLDYSWSSLERIDALLDTLNEETKPDEATFLQQQPNINFLILLAFYVGEVRARVEGVQAQWDHWDTLIQRDPGMRMFGEGFHSAVVQTAPDVFLPLVSIMTRLFEGPEDKSVAFSASMHLIEPADPDPPLPPLPAQSLLPDMAVAFETLKPEHRRAYAPEDWDFLQFGMQRLSRVRDALPRLIHNGRMVWGAIIQANNSVTKPGGMAAAPGEVLYDPRGLLPAETLAENAALLFRLREAQPDNVALQEYRDHLNAETTALFGWQTPPEFNPYPMLASTFCIRTALLPGKRVVSRILPLIISDEDPGTVVIAPWGLWPKEFYEDWCGSLRDVDPTAIAPPQDSALVSATDAVQQAEPSPKRSTAVDVRDEVAAEQDYLDALNKWRSGAAREEALHCWLRAAQADDLRALETLAWLTARGIRPELLGDKPKRWADRALAVARDRTGVLNAGRLMLREDRVDNDYFDMRAAIYLNMADNLGLREARPLLDMLQQRRNKQATHASQSTSAGKHDGRSFLSRLFRR